MYTLEYIILYTWLVGIAIVQFDQQTMRFLMKYDYLGYFPSFRLFSPQPFIGKYVIRYRITSFKDNATITIDEELDYIGQSDCIDTNQKVIKGINNICRSSVTKPTMKNNNYTLLIHYIRNDAKKKSYSGKLQFFILHTTAKREELKLKSRFYDI